MSDRRMFSKRITQTAKFLQMPATSQLLYFHLGLNADDDGIVEAFPVLRMSNCTEDDLRVLVAKDFIKILNQELVIYINDWNENNYIRGDRKKESIYKDLLVQVIDIKKTDKISTLALDNQMSVKCQSSVSQVVDTSKDKLSKDKLSKVKDIYTPIKSLPAELQGLMKEFVDNKIELKQKVTERSVRMLCKKLMSFPENKRKQAIENSIMNGWQGLFLPKDEKLDEEYKKVSIASKKAYIKEQEEKHKTNTQKIAEISKRTDMLEKVIPNDMAKALEIVGGKNDKRRSECISGNNKKLLSN